MAQANFTPIQLYRSSTAAAVPDAANLASGELALNIADGKLYFKNVSNAVTLLASTGGASGNVVGPTSATDGNLAAFDGTTGKLIKQAAAVTIAQGGTGQNTQQTAINALVGTQTANRVLRSNGTNSVLAQVALATDVTGTLAIANGGTGATTLALASIPTFTSADTLSNKNIQARVVALADTTFITINADITDIATQANTSSVFTLTINAPTGTPFNGQKLMLRLRTTNVQTFAWNAIFEGSVDSALPASSTGATKYDYLGFIYNSTAAKWQMVAKNFGF